MKTLHLQVFSEEIKHMVYRKLMLEGEVCFRDDLKHRGRHGRCAVIRYFIFKALS